MTSSLIRRGTVPAAAALLVLGLPAALAAPDRTAVGDVLSYSFVEQDLGTKAPKVKAIFDGADDNAKSDPVAKLKIVEFVPGEAGSTLDVQIKRAKGAGFFRIEVTPKGGLPFDAGLIEIAPPRPDVPETIALRGAELLIPGEGFGSKKGKVIVNGRKARVREWGNESVRVKLHKKTPLGSGVLEVRNSVGSGFSFSLTVSEAAPDAGAREALSAVVGSFPFDARLESDDDTLAASNVDGRLLLTASHSVKKGRVTNELEIDVAVDLDSLTLPALVRLVPGAGDRAVFSRTDSRDDSLLVADLGVPGASGELVITAWNPSTGLLSGTLVAGLSVIGNGSDLVVRDGRFHVTVGSGPASR